MLVGIIDSGISGPACSRVVAARRFSLAHDGSAEPLSAVPDRLGHGTAVAELVLAANAAGSAAEISLVVAQVMTDRPVTTPAQLAAALDWLGARGVALANISLGLREDRAVLAEACARFCAAGRLLIAPVPARGSPVFPAAYQAVIGVTGDARCGPDALSVLTDHAADFGAHPIGPTGAADSAGASFAAARLTARAAALLAARHPPGEIIALLRGAALYRGRERRGKPAR